MKPRPLPTYHDETPHNSPAAALIGYVARIDRILTQTRAQT
eukprot:gene12463-biopygen7893